VIEEPPTATRALKIWDREKDDYPNSETKDVVILGIFKTDK
jgi:hypothetical protein